MTPVSSTHSVRRRHVWGIGLTRTGTTSLNEALVHLGYRAVHRPTTNDLLYGQLQAATDESVAAVFEYLDWRYPHSRFVLTDRDEGDWLRSTAAHRAVRSAARVDELNQHHPPIGNPRRRDRWIELVFTHMRLYGTPHFDENAFLRGRRAYYARVSNYFEHRKRDLLRLRICHGDGWQQLCSFLGNDVPAIPFPNTNARTS